MKLQFEHPLAFQAFALLGLLLPIPALSAPPELHVQGNQLVTSAGCTVRLKGVNVPSLEWTSFGEGPGGNVVAAVSGAVTAWGSRLIRLPLNQDFWFGCNGGGAAYQTRVDNIVNLCSTNNVYVLLELHWSGTASAATAPCGTGWGSSTGQQNMPDANSVTFWQSVSARYANNPAVWFGPYNEPHNVSWGVWRNGGSAGSFTTPGLQVILQAIRAGGANNLIVAGGLDYAYDLRQVPTYALTDSGSGLGVVYDAHIYPHKGPALSSTWDPMITLITNNYPVLIGEFGSPNTGADDGGAFDGAIIPWIEGANNRAYQFSAAGWCFHTGANPHLLTSWTGFAPTSYHGVPVKNWLATPLPNCNNFTPQPTATPTETSTRTDTRTPTETPTVTETSTACLVGGTPCTSTQTATPTESPTSTVTRTSTSTRTSTATRTSSATPTTTPTATDTPTVTETPTRTATPSLLYLLYPNPNDGTIVSFNYQVQGPMDKVTLGVYTTAFRKLHEEKNLPTAPGEHFQVLDWANVPLDLADGIYYVVLTFEAGSVKERKVMKVFLRR